MKSFVCSLRLAVALSIMLVFFGDPSRHANGGAKRPPAKPTPLAMTTNWGGDTCSLIDVDKGKEIGTINVGLKPYDIKVEPEGRYAYVTCSGADFVSVVDIQAMLETEDQRIKVGDSPRDITLNRDATQALVACAGDNSIAVVDIKAKKRLYSVKVGAIPYGIDYINDEKMAIVTLWGSNKVEFVELGDTEGKVVKAIEVGSLPYTVEVSNKGHLALVSCFGSNNIHVIDVKNQKALTAIEVGKSPWGLAISGDGDKALVANFYSGDASVLDVKDIAPDPLGAGEPPVKEIGRIKLVSEDPIGAGAQEPLRRAKNAAFRAGVNEALLSNLGSNEIMVVSIDDKKLVKTISVGKAPYGIAIVPRGE